MLKIGDFSRLSLISIRMLRYYDDHGLLVPDEVDEFTGYRYYNESKLVDAGRITALKNMGFSLSMIKDILKTYNEPKQLKEYLCLKKSELLEEEQSVKDKLLLLENTIKHIGKDNEQMKYDVIIKEIPEREVASVRKIIPQYSNEGMLWGILMQEAGKSHIQESDTPFYSAIMHDKEYKEKDVDVEVQMAIKGTFQETNDVKLRKMPKVTVASTTFKGGYEQLYAVNSAVADWIAGNGYDFDGSYFDVYHVGPSDTKDESKWVTEVCYPVKRK